MCKLDDLSIAVLHFHKIPLFPGNHSLLEFSLLCVCSSFYTLCIITWCEVAVKLIIPFKCLCKLQILLHQCFRLLFLYVTVYFQILRFTFSSCLTQNNYISLYLCLPTHFQIHQFCYLPSDYLILCSYVYACYFLVVALVYILWILSTFSIIPSTFLSFQYTFFYTPCFWWPLICFWHARF